MIQLLENSSWSQRVQMALRLVNASSSEVDVLDKIVKNATNHPMIGLMVGGEITSVQEAVERFSRNDAIADSPWIGSAKKALHHPEMRKNIATLMDGFLPKEQADREAIYSLLGKVVDSPFSSRSSDEVTTSEELIEFGLLEPLMQIVPDHSDHPQSAATFYKCPYCEQIFSK